MSVGIHFITKIFTNMKEHVDLLVNKNKVNKEILDRIHFNYNSKVP